MTYNKQNFPQYVETAGKITVVTALSGIVIFAFIFILNIGKSELTKVEAATGTATTSVTVLNTPPVWVAGEEGQEEFQSSTSTPTNSGSAISWTGRAIDTNGAPYFMVICSNSATPTAGFSTSTLGTVPPSCTGGTQWAVSTSTLSGSRARAATTTTESFVESNVWYAWVCDDDPVNPRCSTTYSQGINATNSSPFYVNHRPVFTAFANDGPKNPGQTITFNSTSSDVDVVTSADHVYLIVCASASYSTTTNQCGAGDTVASSTVVGPLTNASTSKILASILQDTNYNAFPYVFDEHGHSASGGAQGVNVAFTVSNVAPTVAGGSITLNNGSNIILTQEAGQTTGFPLSFIIADANSCVNVASTSEITGYVASVFRSGVGSSTCNGTAGSYDNNSCYPSGVATTTWNLVCVASSTSCTGATDDTKQFDCTFPLWFTADPTDGTATDTPFFAQHWTAGVAGVDDNNATGSMATSTSASVELLSYVAISLQTSLIAYTQLEPGTNMSNLTATTTVRAVGNTGINELLSGDSMCGTYSPSSPCAVSATSTIPQDQQRYATSALAFASGAQLPATTSPATLDIRIPKAIYTATSSVGITYWGIAVPGSISLAGSYTGQNTFMAIRSATNTW